MNKQTLYYVFKINSSRLRKSDWSLDLSIPEAMRNEELVSLADSTVLRFIRDINNSSKCPEDKIEEIRKKIERIHTFPTSMDNKRAVKGLYEKLYDILFIKDYICIVMDNMKDYDRLNQKKGFFINGVKFKRLLGTTGGAKKSTIIFVSEHIYQKLHNRIENNRNLNKELVAGKLEAYKALACSASINVSNPKGILVVKDCETTFKANVIKIDDTITEYPTMTNEKDYDVKLIDSDGYGLISPELSKKWCEELGENYIPSGFCIRNSFCKGMLFTFDFYDFAKSVANKDTVVDVWGNGININDVQIVLTTSMLKLWDSYESIEHYIACCKANGYSFSVSKMIPEELENERNLNYQFIQSLKLSDEDIKELIAPTVNEIKDVLGGDFRRTILFLKGQHMTKKTFFTQESDFIKALMVDKEMVNDPFVISKIKMMITKRINDAKVGVLKVKGNFSIVSGDPYSLCQSIFGLEVTGLLKEGEFYSKYWNDRDVNKVACFRAPMTCHNNIRVLNLVNTDDMKYWYKYMTACTIFNSWDTASHALNGLDKDSDSVLTTNCDVVLKGITPMDAILCVQKTAVKKVITEKDLIQANKNTFGDEIGFTTNIITSMIDVQSKFDPNSEEYKELNYRICCGQNYQQNAIDKAKGIISKSMPKEWYDFITNYIKKETDSDEVKNKKEFNLRILADKKPYFFIYIYPSMMKMYKKYIDNSKKNCLIRFGLTVEQLKSKDNRNEEEDLFLEYYDIMMPVFKNNSVMNRICWAIEDEFRLYDINIKNRSFDYSILQSNNGYKKSRYKEIQKLHKEYIKQVQQYAQVVNSYRIEKEEKSIMRKVFKEGFKMKAYQICSNMDELCNIVVDLCYKENISKQFAWDLCGDNIIQNLLKRNNNTISYPVFDNENGYFEFGGERFSMCSQKLNDEVLNYAVDTE